MEIWFLTGSQHLYGPETLVTVQNHAYEIARALSAKMGTACTISGKQILTRPEEITQVCLDANADKNCAGVILWMHTFSPAKMWINGLSKLQKPVLHLHTQFNQELPWASIDMDFMNLNQAAHGDREAAHIHTRLGLNRKIVVGHWSAPSVQKKIEDWSRIATGFAALQTMKVARFGDNMRSVAVTDGDKVAAAMKFGFAVDGFGLGDLVPYVQGSSDAQVNALLDEYETTYTLAPELHPGGVRRDSLVDAARQEIGIQTFLDERGYTAFTTTFEDLHGLNQLPGLACQRLMAKGYGFGAEGDWKTAALLRFAKIATEGQNGGTSFMEDYTYHLVAGEEAVLGAHMLEICPSITTEKPRLEVHPLGIGGKADPARLVFNAHPGPAISMSLIDLGSRFRLIAHAVDAIEVPPMPNLPVARALWHSRPSFEEGIAAWLHAGGAHHTVYSYDLSMEQVRDFATIANMELVAIDETTRLPDLIDGMRWNALAYS